LKKKCLCEEAYLLGICGWDNELLAVISFLFAEDKFIGGDLIWGISWAVDPSFARALKEPKLGIVGDWVL
jgi:hypothetical protein